MTWTPDEQRQVARSLLGSWPGTVAAWGREALAAYVEQLEDRGLTAESVILAIRAWRSGDFPPSVPNLAKAARAAAFFEWGRTGRLEVLPADERSRFDRAAVRATVRRELEAGTTTTIGDRQ